MSDIARDQSVVPRLDVAAGVLTAGGQDEVGAFSAKAFRGGQADTPRRARDHQNLAVEPAHIHRHGPDRGWFDRRAAGTATTARRSRFAPTGSLSP
jgi:hypothetical protein